MTVHAFVDESKRGRLYLVSAAIARPAQLDRRTIRAVLGNQPTDPDLVYEHIESGRECLLWIADAAGRCYGAGGHWRQRVDDVISRVIELD